MQYEIKTTNIFDKWLAGIKDMKSRARIIKRFDHIQMGNLGDHKSLGSGLFELRFFSALGSVLTTPSMIQRLSSCFVAVTNPAKAKTLKRQRL